MLCLSETSSPAPSKGHGYFLILLYMIVASVTAGVIIGYGELYPILLDSEVFHDLCVPGTPKDTPCPAQNSALSNLLEIGASVNIFIQAPSGLLLDFAGPKITSWIGLSILLIGSLIFAYSGPTFNGYTAGFTLLSTGGPFVFLSVLHIASVFPNRSAFIMALLNGAFSACALIFLVFNKLYYSYNISLKDLFISYSVMIGIIFLSTLFFWPWRKFSNATKISIVNDNDIQSKQNVAEVEEPYWVSLKKSVLTFDYLWLLIYIPVMINMSNFYLGTSNYQIALVTKNQDLINYYADIFGLMLPIIGLLASPIGLLIDKWGINSGIFLFVTLSTISHTMGMIRILPLQIVRFIAFSIYYPYTYTLWSDFIAKKFGFRTYGALFGMIAFLAGILGIGVSALVNYAVETNNYDWINIGWILATLCGLIYPLSHLCSKCHHYFNTYTNIK